MAQPTATGPGDYANQKLVELWQQTGDKTILDYINSGWTTPVSVAVAPQVQAIIRRYSNPSATVRVTGGQTSPIPGAAGAPPDQQPLVNLPTGGGTAPPVSSVWPDQPPGAGANNPGQGGGARPFDQSGQTTAANPLGIFPGKDTGQGGGAPGGNLATFWGAGGGSPAGPGGTPLPFNGGDQAAIAQAISGAQAGTRTAAAGARGGGQSVNPPGFTPAPGNPTTNPTVPGATGPFGGSIDPTSAVAQQGYAQAQAGDSTALSAVLTQILGKFGIDVNRGGIFTPGLVSSLAPYLKTVMEYGGLANGGKPVIPSQLADQFGGMIGGANTFGQIQDFARNLLPTAQGLLGAPAGALADTSNQVGMVNDLLGMLTAGANPIYQQYQQGVAKKGLSDYVQSQLGGPTANYIDWMRQNAGKIPGSDLLAQIIGASR